MTTVVAVTMIAIVVKLITRIRRVWVIIVRVVIVIARGILRCRAVVNIYMPASSKLGCCGTLTLIV